MGGGPVFRSLAALGTLGSPKRRKRNPFKISATITPSTQPQADPPVYPRWRTDRRGDGYGCGLDDAGSPALHTMPVLGQKNAEDTTAQQKARCLGRSGTRARGPWSRRKYAHVAG